jgi:AmmeMemoRadiSam system protein A
MALSPADAWQTPFGPLAVDRASRDALARQTGVIVSPQPFVNEHSLEVHLPFVHRTLGEVQILPILVAQAPREQVSQTLHMLWGGPETAIVISSDLSHYHDYATCTAIDAETAIGIERLQPQGCDGDRACGRYSIHGLLDQAQRRDLRVTALDIRNSGDTRGPKDRVVGYGAFAFEYAHSARIADSTRARLLQLAKDAIRHGIGNPAAAFRPGFDAPPDRVLQAQRATFVTIKIGDRLRGCRGSLLPHRSLLDDVLENARKSAFDDPRFPPLTEAEVAQINVHISVLSTPRRLPASTELELARALRPDVDGLIIRDSNCQALFLPSVWSGLPDPLSFIRQLKHKAGLPPEHWSANFLAFRFTAESFGDGEDS